MREKVERTPRHLSGPVALIIGCGDMGIGCARVLGRRRPLIIVDIEPERLEPGAALLREEGYAVSTRVCDISNPEQVGELSRALSTGPGISILAHVAALGRMGDGGWRQVVDVNLRGAHLVARAVEAQMIAGGVAIFISSIGGYMTATNAAIDQLLDAPGGPEFHEKLLGAFGREPTFQEIYNMAKKGLHRLARRLAVDWGPREVRALSVSPGMIDSTMGRAGGNSLSIPEGSGGTMLITRSEMAVRTIPLGRQGSILEITSVVEFLASEAASFVNGIDIPVDGGANAMRSQGEVTG